MNKTLAVYGRRKGRCVEIIYDKNQMKKEKESDPPLDFSKLPKWYME